MSNNHKQLTECALIEAYLQGDEQAINELIKRTSNKVYTSVYILVKDKYLAEDITQETYLKAVQKLKANGYTHDNKFGAWLVRIARNLSMDYFRTLQRKSNITLSNGKDIFEVFDFSTDENVETKWMNNQSAERVRKMLGLIPHDQRDVIVMRLFGEMSFKEIAATTDATLNTCLGRMRYGLINLRKLMQEKSLVL
jgi:RNA polymerase sigma factor (sigma-70 family)